ADRFTEVYGIRRVFFERIRKRYFYASPFDPGIEGLLEVGRYADFFERVGELDKFIELNSYFFSAEVTGEVWWSLLDDSGRNRILGPALWLLDTCALPRKRKKDRKKQ